MLDIIWWVILIYASQFGLMAAVHQLNDSRIPRSKWELMQMTFAPYALFNLKKFKEIKIKSILRRYSEGFDDWCKEEYGK